VIAAAAECLTWLVDREPDIDIEVFASVIDRISPLAAARAKAIAGSASTGGFALRQAAKDMELVGDEFGTGGVMESVRGLTREGLELGNGDLDVACLGSVVRSRGTS